jgi:hypothetical protein
MDPGRGERTPSATRGISWSVAALLVLIVALAVRFAVVADLADLPTQHALVEDARAYDETARELLANDWLPERAFYQSPLYPYFLAACYRWLAETPVAVRLVQALAGALAALVLAFCGRRLGGTRVGLLTGLLAALFAPFLFYTPLLLKPTLLILFESLFVLAVLSLDRDRSHWLVAAAGLSLGLAVLMRGNLMLLVPFLGLFWVLDWLRRGEHREDGSRRRLVTELAVLAAGFAIAILPISLVNYAASGELVLSSSQSGSNFYIGNHGGASGIYEPLVAGRQSPELEQEDARRVAAGIVSRETGVAVDSEEISPTEVSRAFWRQSGRDIVADPLAWSRLMVRKTMLFWNAYEIPDAESFDVYRLESAWLRWNPILFGLIAPLGILGLWIDFRERRSPFFLLMILASMISVVLFYVFGRYRLPIVPFLLPLAAVAVFRIADLVRRRRTRALIAPLGLLLAAGIVVWWPLVSREFQRAQLGIGHYMLGVSASQLTRQSLDRDLSEASRWSVVAGEHLDLSRELDSGFLPAWIETAVLRLRQGHLAQRQSRFDMARRLYLEAEELLEAIARAEESSVRGTAVADARQQILPDVWRALAGVDIAISRQLAATGDLGGASTALAEAKQRQAWLQASGSALASGLATEISTLERELATR